jgi:FimV-like protein
MIAVVFVVLLTLLNSARADEAPSTQPAKTGEFDITLTQRSPESDYEKLVARIGLPKEKLGPDYDLSQEPLVIYVPTKYDPKNPPGLIVQIFQDGSPNIYEPLRPILDEQNLIMIATHKDHRPVLNAVGLCFDAVYNLKQAYAIDSSRVYFIGLGQTEEPIGWCTGELFVGDVYIGWVGWNRPLSGNPPLFEVNPPPALMRQAKQHMQILAFPAEQNSPDNIYWQKTVAGTMRSDGFDHVLVAPVGHDQILRPEWFRQTLQQLHSVKSNATVAHAAATKPSTINEPERLLNLAQAYISSGAKDMARTKLNQIIEKYPNDPAAKKAQALLDELDSK